MNTYLRLTQAYPALYWVLQDASHSTTERQRQDLRYRIRIIGMTPADTAVALGILASCLDGDERKAA